MVPTHATTYDLDNYYADLKSVPRLSDEERLRLLRQAGSASTATGAGAAEPVAPSMLPQQGRGTVTASSQVGEHGRARNTDGGKGAGQPCRLFAATKPN
jgi:hypothetical protein